jgi:hypothetical protein
MQRLFKKRRKGKETKEKGRKENKKGIEKERKENRRILVSAVGP